MPDVGSRLEDVTSAGVMLVEKWHCAAATVSSWHCYPILGVWPAGAAQPSAEVSLSDWLSFQKELPPGVDADGPCKFVAGGDQVICVQGPRLDLIDVRAKKEIRQVTAVKDAREIRGKAIHLPYAKRDAGTGKLRFDFAKPGGVMYEANPPILAIDPKGGRVAVAYNGQTGDRVFLFSSDLARQLASWTLPKKVQDLFWSPDGRRLGILYYNAYEPYNWQGKWTGWHPGVALAGVSDVSIFDVASGNKLLSFATDGVEAKAAFSPDGKLIYVITHSLAGAGYGWGNSSWEEETLRAFSSETGKLVRTFRVSGTGVRDNFAVSPDGRFIAAETNKDAHSDLYYLLRLRENLGGDLNAGFVILDASTGRIVFREKREMSGELTDTLPLFFPASGDTLIAEFGDPPRQLVAYSLSH